MLFYVFAVSISRCRRDFEAYLPYVNIIAKRGVVMNDMSIFTEIEIRRNNFTNVENKIAAQVLENPKEILNISISDFAAKCDVSDASVFRFCKTIGYKGYQDFKMAIVRGLSERGEGKELLISNELSAKDSFSEILDALLRNNISGLNETRKMVDIHLIEAVVDRMAEAKTILFSGVGSSLLVAEEGYSRFIRITPKVKCPLDAHHLAMEASLLTEKDVAIIISFSGSTKDSVECAALAKAAGAYVVILTHYVKSPLAQYADAILVCSSVDSGPLQGGSLTAQISLLYLLDALYLLYFSKQYPTAAENKRITSNAIIEKMF